MFTLNALIIIYDRPTLDILPLCMLVGIYECKQKMGVGSITVSTFAKESSQGTESSTTYAYC
jgi:hypothetical protein